MKKNFKVFLLDLVSCYINAILQLCIENILLTIIYLLSGGEYLKTIVFEYGKEK